MTKRTKQDPIGKSLKERPKETESDLLIGTIAIAGYLGHCEEHLRAVLALSWPRHD